MARILLIEDDPSLRTLIQHTLEADGHAVTAAANGRAGLQCMRDFTPDLVLTDVIMPDTDGLEIIMEVHHCNPLMRMIAMTGGGYFSRDALLRMARQLGASDVLPKPFDPDTLKRCVDAALHRPEVAAATMQP